MTGVRTSALHG